MPGQGSKPIHRVSFVRSCKEIGYTFYIGITLLLQHAGLTGYMRFGNAIYPSSIPPYILSFHLGKSGSKRNLPVKCNLSNDVRLFFSESLGVIYESGRESPVFRLDTGDCHVSTAGTGNE